MRNDKIGVTEGRLALGRARGAQAVGRGEVSQAWLGWLFTAPVALLIVALVGYPLVLSLQMSMQDVAVYPSETSRFVGLDNYIDLLTAKETISAATHTASYWLIAVTVEIGIGLAAALALRRPFRGRGVVLAVLVLPWALPPVVSGLLWSRIYDPTSGWLNGILLQVGIIDEYLVWFTHSLSTIPLIALVHAWGLIPLVTLILLGGLQGIPSDLYEAAQADGASPYRSFRHITLPLLRPSLVAALAIGTVVSFGIFDVIYVLVGADRDARSVMMQVYLTTFANLDFGRGAALAVLLSLASLSMSTLYMLGSRRSAR